jgi:predicted dehydrogenase
MATIEGSTPVGVIGVGSMGHQHARVYGELPSATLVGVSDADPEQAREVAEEYGTTALSVDRLLSAVEAVSIAAPDQYHHDLARQALDADVDVLVEKPFVTDVEDGRDLIRRAERADLVLQVGHVERFNPAVRTVGDVLVDEDVITIEADRLGPPLDRDVDGGPVPDLMIHDIDVVCSLLDEEVRTVQATAAGDQPHVTAVLTFESGTTARLTASRVTQQKVRTLAVTTHNARVTADYLSQTVEIHRQSVPEYVATNGDVRYRHEGIVERPTVERGEPLRNELRSFVDAVRTDDQPEVTGEDGLRALEIAQVVEDLATERRQPVEVAR